ncbi:hypothetical protein SDC9_124430 [bioreactor metagenome]|uniref:Uncharacterized protein n=1 Tax=bioreactor metagenome TaxID=1076179 RepID=A0A645CKF5_9ZZZZ
MLRTFILAADHSPGRQVSDAHRAVGGIHMLAARAAGAVGIDAQVFFLKFDRNIISELGYQVDRGK